MKAGDVIKVNGQDCYVLDMEYESATGEKAFCVSAKISFIQCLCMQMDAIQKKATKEAMYGRIWTICRYRGEKAA